ncbi:MAG: PAS domain-containing protein [Chloroflexales bacterium]|nr:PAS domain-containing protein [Chloroflexales bacterium]
MGSSVDRRLLAIIPALLFTSRPDGTWDYVSPPFCAYTGRPADMLMGLGWASALHADDQAPSLTRWRIATTNGAPWQVEHRLCGADGVYRWFRTQCAPQHDATGALSSWAGIALPVDSEHQLAAERALRQSAEQARDERDSMLAIIAHELRAPLTVLLGQATLLQRRLDAHESTEPRDRRAAETLVTQTIRLRDLMSALLDVTQIDYGQLRVCTTTLDLGALVGRVVQVLAPTLLTHRLRLRADPAPLWVAGDALRLEQVLQNLLQNAVKYSPDGGEIMIRTASHGDQVQIEVCDQGLGIPADVQPYLFQRFFRARAEDQRLMPGMGLGLYLCKAIMDLHGAALVCRASRARAAP